MRLKAAAIFIALITIGNIANANQYTNGYIRKDGTYVAPYVRTTPNNSVYDNYSTRGNTNPYTGERGYVNPYSSYGSQNTRTYNPYSNPYRR